MDTCTANDICETATEFPPLETDSASVCIEGCVLGALPDSFSDICGMDTLPTIWYEIHTDLTAEYLNVNLTFPQSSTTRLSVFKRGSSCDSLQPLPLPLQNNFCKSSTTGSLIVQLIRVDTMSTFLIAISSTDVTGGIFNLCLNTVARIPCLVSGDIHITSRSSGLDEDEPYLPGEQVGVCMEVTEFQTGSFNGCQWFQGIVPYFGSAWDPSGFDPMGQPFNATINGFEMGEYGNGLYGVSNNHATWDWFTDIGYHWTNDTLQIGDIDGNATLDLCSTKYEDCQDFGGVTGGCCPACWTDSGQMLPPGWFAYGIQGSCTETGHPGVDWGDGITCDGPMGPWHFCFDLKVKSFPDCLQHSPEKDLRLSYYTKSDGETGAITGGKSLCVGDEPRIRHLPLSCGTNVQELESETLPYVCDGDTLSYLLSEPGVIHWYWNIEPRGFNYPPTGNTSNGTVFQDVFFNPTSDPVEITYFLRGSLDSVGSYVSKEISFVIFPGNLGLIEDHLEVCEAVTDSVTYTVKVIGELDDYMYLWLATGDTTPSITIYAPYQDTSFVVMVTDINGCSHLNQLNVSIDSSCVIFDLPARYDVSNEGKTQANPPPIPLPSQINIQKSDHQELIVYPVPTKDNIVVKWSTTLSSSAQLTILNANGVILQQQILSQPSMGYLEIETIDYPPGIYMVLLQDDQLRYTSRFVKM